MSELKILHLSDLHFDSSKPRDTEIVLNALWNDLENFSGIDLILFSGDLVNAGDVKGDFEMAYQVFIEPLLSKTNLTRHDFFLVPGNHDIQRRRIARVIEAGLKATLKDRESLNAFLDVEIKNGFENVNCLDHFNEFKIRFNAGHTVTSNKLFSTHIINKKNVSIGIACLNSSWRATGGGHDYGVLLIGERQVQEALIGIQDCDLKIAMYHHPLEWLMEYDQSGVNAILFRNFDLLFFGNLHNEREFVQHLENGPVLIQGSYLNINRPYHLGYSVLNIDAQKGKGTIYLRSYFDERKRFDSSVDIVQDGVVNINLRIFLKRKDDGDELIELDEIEQAIESTPLARLSADTVEGDDKLGIEREVNAFSSVFAAKSTTPPLCLGLFGDWGAGKTFFMKKMEERIRFLADKSGEAESNNKETFYHSHIAHITFNAWHYMDANLWASLVNRIFDGLSDFLKEKEMENRKAELFGELETTKMMIEETKRVQKLAENEMTAIEKQLEELRVERETKSADLRVLRAEFFKDYLDNKDQKNIKNRLEKAAQNLGIPHIINTYEEAINTVEKLNAIKGRFETISRALLHAPPRDRWLRIILLFLILIGIPALPVIFKWLINLIDNQLIFDSLSTAITQGTTFIVGILGWFDRMILKKSGAVIKELESAQEGVEELMKASREAPSEEEKGLLQALSGLQERETAIKNKLTDAQERFNKAKAELEELQELKDGRRLSQFIQERVASEDYRNQLGIISMIRRDLETLSDELKPSKKKKKSLPRIDRIILYIDDLDRCPEERVVAVLQAVHLLLFFELFIVVVGVDSRWILHSLVKSYYPLQNKDAEIIGEEGERVWESTPQNYLEKIFQVPYHLRSMKQSGGFQNLVESIMETPQGEKKNGQVSLKTQNEKEEKGKPLSEDEETEPEAPQEPKQPLKKSGDEVKATEGKEFPGSKQSNKPDTEDSYEELQVDLTPEFLKIKDFEKDFILHLEEMIPTPRSLKHFINIYRLIRSSVEPEEVPQFVGEKEKPGEFQALMVLLAILTGFPRQAPYLFKKILNSDKREKWSIYVDALKPVYVKEEKSEIKILGNFCLDSMDRRDAVQWNRLYETLNQVKGKIALPNVLEPYIRWAPAVARFSYRGEKAADFYDPIE